MKCHFLHLRIPRVHTIIVIITVNVDLDDLAEPVFVRFFCCEVIIPLSTLYSLKGSYYVQPTFKKWGVNYENC